MATFENLEIDKFYLIKVKEEDDITMVQVGMATEKCVLVYEFDDDYEGTYWKKKDDPIAEIVEELTDEQVDEYENLLEDDEWNDGDEDEDFLDFKEQDDDEDDDEEDDDDDDDDDEEDDKEKKDDDKKKKKKKKK